METGAFDFTEIKKWIGKEQELGENEAYLSRQPVERQEIRRVALANGDYNLLWLDQEYARKSKWGGIIAPPLFLGACGSVVSAARPLEIPGVDYYAIFYSGVEWEFRRPVRVGDTIRPVWKLCDVYEKAGRFAGPIAVTVGETAFNNQRGEVLGVCRTSLIQFSRARGQKAQKYELPEGRAPEPTGYPDAKKGEVTARGAVPLYYEDIMEGTEVRSLVKGPLTIPMIVQQATCARVGLTLLYTTPPHACYWHYNEAGAWNVRALPAPFDIGIWRPTWFAQLMTDWIGDEGWLKKLKVRIQLPNFAGDTTTCRGKVTRKYVEGNDHLVECEIEGVNQRGETHTVGSATVILPSRGE